jgi:hypothetical protein
VVWASSTCDGALQGPSREAACPRPWPLGPFPQGALPAGPSKPHRGGAPRHRGCHWHCGSTAAVWWLCPLTGPRVSHAWPAQVQGSMSAATVDVPLGKVERRPIAMHIDADMLGPSGCQPSRSSATTGSPGETGSYSASPIGPLRTYSQRSSALPRQRQQHQLLLVPFAEWNGASTARGPPALRAAPVESRRSERKPLKREAGMKGPHLHRDWARCCHICAGAARRDECSSARSYWRRLEGASAGLARCEKQTRACTSTHASTHARQALPRWTQRR